MAYTRLADVPRFDREPGAFDFVLAIILPPVAIAICVIALTGNVYQKQTDASGHRKVWGVGNKIAAVLIVQFQIFFIWVSFKLR